MQEIAEGPRKRNPAALELQIDVYVGGSASIVRIAARTGLLKNMFLDFVSLKISLTNLSEWEAALWVRSRVMGGTKTAGRNARACLALAARCTGERFFEDSALVKAQAAPRYGARAASDPPVPAIPLEWRHIQALEKVIEEGATPQQRVLAGFFVFLVQTASRCSDGQRSRKIRLSGDALLGESLMKGKPSWSRHCLAHRPPLRFKRMSAYKPYHWQCA